MVNAMELLQNYRNAESQIADRNQAMQIQAAEEQRNAMLAPVTLRRQQLALQGDEMRQNALMQAASGNTNALMALDPKFAIQNQMQRQALERQDRAERANEQYRNEQLRLKRLELDPFNMLGANPQGGMSATTSVSPTQSAPQAPQSQPKMEGTGQGPNASILQNLPAPVADQVKALADGRMAFPSGFALKSPYWQKMISLVSEYDPSFDAVNYNARAKTRSDMTSGQGARNLTAINTAIGHLDSLDKAATALNNSDIPSFNSFINSIGPAMGNTNLAGRLRTFQQSKEAVANELMRVFRGTGASSADTKQWAETINAADSPEALKASVRSAVDLLKSRIGALNEQYTRGMGKTTDVMDFIDPKARATLDRLSGEGETKGLSPEIDALVKKYAK